jgi:hypothetical protein
MKHKVATTHPAPDPDLDRTCSELRRRIPRLGHGQVFLKVNVEAGLVTGAAFSECRETWEDVREAMTGCPHKVELKTGRR